MCRFSRFMATNKNLWFPQKRTPLLGAKVPTSAGMDQTICAFGHCQHSLSCFGGTTLPETSRLEDDSFPFGIYTLFSGANCLVSGRVYKYSGNNKTFQGLWLLALGSGDFWGVSLLLQWNVKARDPFYRKKTHGYKITMGTRNLHF